MISAVVCVLKSRCSHVEEAAFAVVWSLLIGCRLQSTDLPTPVNRLADSSQQACRLQSTGLPTPVNR
ncbi:MAG: hypothetical protein K6G46_00750 [Prevotella sp.]|nr:hypothetical protein [Prevotella sp.]